MEEQSERARLRYAGCCGYCGVHEDNAGATLTIDHHRPRAYGGNDDDVNIIYCCPSAMPIKGLTGMKLTRPTSACFIPAMM